MLEDAFKKSSVNKTVLLHACKIISFFAAAKSNFKWKIDFLKLSYAVSSNRNLSKL